MIDNKYDTILNAFRKYYPDLGNSIVDWWPSGRYCIMMKFNDETVFEFNDFDRTIRRVKLSDVFDEDSAKSSFAANLQKYIMSSSMPYGDVAKEAGITNVMLSRYIHGNAVPSIVKAKRLASVIGCRLDDLFD